MITEKTGMGTITQTHLSFRVTIVEKAYLPTQTLKVTIAKWIFPIYLHLNHMPRWEK